MKNKFKNLSFYLTQVILLIFMTIWNLLTPLYGDDLYFAKENIHSIIRNGINEYFTWNARIVGQSITRLLLMGHLKTASFLNAAAFLALSLLIFFLSTNQRTYMNPAKNKRFASQVIKHPKSTLKYIIIIFMIFLFMPSFAQVVLWRAGSGNYLWTLMFNLLFIYIFTKNIFKTHKFNFQSTITLILVSLLALAAGWSNENTGGGTLIVLLGYSTYYFLKYHKYSKRNILWLIIFIIGYLALLLAPGNKKRIECQGQFKNVGFRQKEM